MSKNACSLGEGRKAERNDSPRDECYFSRIVAVEVNDDVERQRSVAPVAAPLTRVLSSDSNSSSTKWITSSNVLMISFWATLHQDMSAEIYGIYTIIFEEKYSKDR